MAPDSQPQAEEDSDLAAIIQAVADGRPLTDLERDILRLRLITEARSRGATWAAVGAALGMSGQQAKKEARRLEHAVKETLLKQALAGES